MGLVLITHDLGVVEEAADRMMVMYAGRVVESGRTDDVFAHMAHPYYAGPVRGLAARGDARPGPRGRRPQAAPPRHPGPGARSAAPPGGLCLRPALPARAGRLPHRAAATRAAGPAGSPRPTRPPACIRTRPQAGPIRSRSCCAARGEPS